MTNKFGQRYSCTLPDVSEELGRAAAADNNPEALTRETKALLAPMAKAAQCMLKTKDWWTYEFCYGQAIRQYHMEGEEMSLELFVKLLSY